ncbi:MAG: hypothetical protein HEQ39_09630 [Rhizobacter sp.]
MKAAKTLLDSLSDIENVSTQGDLRRIVANSLLALARKEVSATDVEAMAKGLDSISNSLNAEIKVAKTSMELREKGGSLGKVVHLGQLLIGKPEQEG